MSTVEIIDYLSILVLVGLLVALGFLIVLLYRANRIVYKTEHLSDTFKHFVADIVPAIVNIGTLTTAIESIMRYLHEERVNKNGKSLGLKKEVK